MTQKTKTVPNSWAQRMVGTPVFPPRHAMAALRAVGLREAYVVRPDGRIRIGDEIALLTHLCRDGGGGLAAVRAAAGADWRPAAPIINAFGACGGRTDMLRFLVRHAALVRPFNPLRIDRVDGTATLAISAPLTTVPATPEWLAWSLAASVCQVRTILGREAPGLRLQLGPEIPVDPVAVGAGLGLPCAGDPERSGLVLPLEVAVHEVDRQTSRLAESLLSPVTRHGKLGDAAAALLAALPLGQAGMADVARACGETRVQLRSRLEAEGMTFRDLTDRVRQEAIPSFWRCPDLVRAEIAFLLGFETEQAYVAYLWRSGLSGRENQTARDRFGPRPFPVAGRSAAESQDWPVPRQARLVSVDVVEILRRSAV